MHAALVIARKELAQRLRDKSFFIVGLIAPLALAFIFNLVIGGAISGDSNPTFDFGVADADAGPVSDGFDQMLAGLSEEGLVVVTRYETAEAARAAADAGDVDAAFILPGSLSTAMILGETATIDVVGNVDSQFGGQVARAIAEGFARQAEIAARATRAAIGAGVLDPANAATLAAEAAAAPMPVALQQVEVQSRQLSSATFFTAGLGIFFIIFVAGLATTSLLEERTNGTLARLLAAPIPAAAITGGKTLANVGLGIVAMTILAIASTVLMGADWGSPVFALLIIIAAVIGVAGVMTFVGGLAKTAEQASNLQAIVAVTFGMLGGTFMPIAEGSGILSSLRFLTPNAWYMRGLDDLAGGATGDALVAVAVLLGIGILFGGAGLYLAQRTLRP
jgi:ABC-2 type transport system permease protein